MAVKTHKKKNDPRVVTPENESKHYSGGDKKKKKPEAEQSLPQGVTEPVVDKKLEEQHAAAIKHLAEDCVEMDYTIPWLPTTKVASEGTRNKMLKVVGGKKKGYSVSKRMFNSGHPLIDELNGCKRRIEQWRDGFVIVKSAEATVDEEGRKKIASGVRLIQTVDIEPFEKGFKERVDQLYAALEMVDRYMDKTYDDGKKKWPSILDWDAEFQGDDFNKSDYPKSVKDCINVTMPSYNAYTVSVKLPPQVYQRQEKRLQEALNGTLETATGYICSTLNDVFTTFAGQLVDRVRVYPKDVRYSKYHGAEVVSILTHDQKLTIPKGMMELELRRKETIEVPVDPAQPDGEKKDKERSVVEKLELIPESEYEELFKPERTEERKKLTQSVLDNIYLQMEQIGKVSTMIGPYGDKILNVMAKVKEVLKTGGKTSDEVIEEAKASKSFRATLATSLTDAVSKLGETAVLVTKVRRRISNKLAGEV